MIPIMKYFVGTEPLVKVIGPSADGNSTVFYLLATPLGSPKKKDFHGEYFKPTTYFGDDLMKTHYAFYEHLMNDYSNPFMAQMGREKQILGVSTLLTDEQKKDAGLDIAERWADFEVKRSLEYHDMLVNLVDAKMMGASTQCFMNGKTRQEDGGIDFWLENERSMTPTPAAAATLGKVIEVYSKSYKPVNPATPLLPKLKMVKDGQLVDIDFEHPEAAFEAVPPEPEPAVDSDQPLAATIDALLSDEPEATPEEIPADVKSLVTSYKSLLEEVKALKASMSVFIELWGATPEEAKEAILSMMGQQKSSAELLGKLEKSSNETKEGILAIAKHMKTQKVEALKQNGSSREIQLLNPVEAEPGQPGVKPKSGVPDKIRKNAQ